MKKWMNIIFCLIFLLSLIFPFTATDFRKNQASEIDNEYLPELDNVLLEEMPSAVENYFNKRIGFRMEALDLYQKINDRIFGLLEHPTYMYGSDGHVFFKSSRFVSRYQHLDLNQEEANRFAEALAGFQQYAESRGKRFMYWLLPNKETVYPEYYPKSINVLGDISYIDQLLSALEEHQVNHLYGKDAMVNAKEFMLVNNVKYDAGHWNENGAFVSCQNFYSAIQDWYPGVKPLVLEDYTVNMAVVKSLDTSHFEIHEEVPCYNLIESHAENQTEAFRSKAYLSFSDNYAYHYVNPTCQDQPSILFFSDSYLGSNMKFFTEHFSETTFIHRYNCLNQEAFEYYVDLVNPDIVIFENPERSLPIDLYQDFIKP